MAAQERVVSAREGKEPPPLRRLVTAAGVKRRCSRLPQRSLRPCASSSLGSSRAMPASRRALQSSPRRVRYGEMWGDMGRYGLAEESSTSEGSTHSRGGTCKRRYGEIGETCTRRYGEIGETCKRRCG